MIPEPVRFTLQMDGQTVDPTGWQAFNGTDAPKMVGKAIRITPGIHYLVATAPFAVTVHGSSVDESSSIVG